MPKSPMDGLAQAIIQAHRLIVKAFVAEAGYTRPKGIIHELDQNQAL